MIFGSANVALPNTDPQFGDALASAFREVVRPQDRLLLLPVYDAGGTTDHTVNSDDLARKMEAMGCAAPELVPDLDAAFEWMSAHRGEYAAFVTAGARDPGLPLLAVRLAESL